MNFNEYIPTNPLYANNVQALWQIDYSTHFYHETIVPKGIIEVIFNFSQGEPAITHPNGSSYRLPACFISGFSTRPIQVRLPEQQVFFGVVFQPFAVQQIFGMPAGELIDCTVDLTLVSKEICFLWEALASQSSFARRVAYLLQWVGQRLFVPQPREQFIQHFLSVPASEDYSVNGLATQLCYSPRQLSRKMTAVTGMNTETILLYKKYLHALHLVHHSQATLTAIGYHCRFADQSHFIKSFRSFAHITPGEYRKLKSPVMAHLYKDVR